MLTLILKGTNGCNLNCAYCSLGEKPRHDIVSLQMLDRIIEYVCGICRQRGEARLNIILHGGEPTLVPVNTYETAIFYARNRFPDIKIGIAMQTNAYCISEEYLSFFQRHNVSVGVSIDGSAEIHNYGRKGKNGQNTYELVIKNIERMLSMGLNVSCLMVLNGIGVSAPIDYLWYFASRHMHLKINPLLNYGEACKYHELAIKKGDYANYLIRIYEYILNNNINITISPIDKILLAILRKDRIHECTFNMECNSNFLCIDHMGNIFPCGKFSDIQRFKLGNVLSETGDILYASQMQKLIDRRKTELPVKCRACKYIGLCHAGCSADAYIEKAMGEPPFLCEDYKLLFDYFNNKGLLLLREQMVKSKQQLIEEANGI